MARTWGQVLSGEGLKKFNAFFRNVNTINLKIFLFYTSLRENSTSILERELKL